MFCSNCGKELPRGASFCSYCGYQLKEKEESYAQPQSDNGAMNEQVAADHPYHELGGFLKFIVYAGYVSAFCLLIHIVWLLISFNQNMSSLDGFASLFGLYGSLSDSIFPIECGIVLATIAAEILLLRLLGKIRRKEAGFLWFYHKMCIFFFVVIMLIFFFSGRHTSVLSLFVSGMSGFLSAIVGIVIYTLYFIKSVRVRTYMGSTDYLRCDPFTKSCPSPRPADGSEAERIKGNLSDIDDDGKFFIIAALMWILAFCIFNFGLKQMMNPSMYEDRDEYSDSEGWDFQQESGNTDYNALWENSESSTDNGGYGENYVGIQGGADEMGEPQLNAEEEPEENEEYILPDSDTRLLTTNDIMELSKDELRLARNEIYARHGRLFSDVGLQEYFNGKEWYDGRIAPEDFVDKEMLSELELKNLDVITLYEKEKGYR